jgi:hypothetical protein
MISYEQFELEKYGEITVVFDYEGKIRAVIDRNDGSISEHIQQALEAAGLDIRISKTRKLEMPRRLKDIEEFLGY